MKILQVNVVYNNGSTGKIVHDIHRVLEQKGIESIVCYGRGQRTNEPNVYKTSSEILAKFNALKARIAGLQYNGSFIATRNLINIIKRERPDVVHLHCINGYFVNIYKLINFLKESKIKTVLTLHAEFMHTGSCGYSYECNKWMSGCGNCPRLWNSTKSYIFDRTHSAWTKMKESFEGWEEVNIIGVSQWIIDRAKSSSIMSEKKFGLIHNGIETHGIFYIKSKAIEQYRRKLNIKENEKIVLNVTPSLKDKLKGGQYLIQLANSMKDEKCKFIVIGCGDDSIDFPPNVIALGKISDQSELADYYNLADVMVITSVGDNYPTVCLEAISCGTPVVGFDVGGVKETIYNGLGEVVTPFDISKLSEAAAYWMNNKYNISKDLIEAARNFNSKERMCEEYLKIYMNLYEES